jgi:hypothetical protein
MLIAELKAGHALRWEEVEIYARKWEKVTI